MSKQPDLADLALTYASTDDDVALIHRFLMEVAVPVWMESLKLTIEQIDPVRVMHEVYKVTHEKVAILAHIKGELVGTLGVTDVDTYFMKRPIYTDRWFFVLPEYFNTEVGRSLKREAEAIANMNGSFFIPWPNAKRKQIRMITEPKAISEAHDVRIR